jgi:hypothetical protein
MSNVMRIALASVLAIAVGGVLYGGYRFVSVTAPAASPSPVVAPASPSTATPSAGTGNAWVTGTMTCGGGQGTYQTSAEGVDHYPAMHYTCALQASDPRLTGRFTETAAADCYPLTPPSTGCVGVASGTFEGPDWTGSIIATMDPAGHMAIRIVETGTGANAGWTFIGSFAEDGNFSGPLYQGPPPTVPSPSPAM